jgi:hypothetical protein
MDNAFKFDGLFLHASAVNMNGGACLFLGHSTSGKSTIARLLEKQAPVLADDAVLASRDPEGIWRVVDGGFRFDRDMEAGFPETIRRRSAAGLGVPVKAIFRLHKGPFARLEPLDPLDLARVLMDAAMEIDLQRTAGRRKGSKESGKPNVLLEREMRSEWFRRVSEIARTLPGWHLWFSKNGSETELHSILASAAPKT